MSQTELLNEARRLAVPERLALIDQLLESVALEEAELPPEIEAELDRRYRAFLANPNEGEPWEVVRERIRRKLDGAQPHHPA